MDRPKPKSTSAVAAASYQSFRVWMEQSRFASLAQHGALCSIITLQNNAPMTLGNPAQAGLKLISDPKWQVPFIPAQSLVKACHHYLEGMVDLLEDLFDEQAVGKQNLHDFAAWAGAKQKPTSLLLADAFPAVDHQKEWSRWQYASDTVALGQKLAVPLIYPSRLKREREHFVQTVFVPTMRRADWSFVEQRVWC